MKYLLTIIIQVVISMSSFGQCGENIMKTIDSITFDKDCKNEYYVTVNTIPGNSGYINCGVFRFANSIFVRQSKNDSINYDISILSYKSLTIRGLTIISYFKNQGNYFTSDFKDEISRLSSGNKVIIYDIVVKLPTDKKLILNPIFYIME